MTVSASKKADKSAADSWNASDRSVLFSIVMTAFVKMSSSLRDGGRRSRRLSAQM